MVHEDAQIHQVVAILEAHHPVGMDESTEGEPTESTFQGNREGLITSPSSLTGSVGSPSAADVPSASTEDLAATEREEIVPLAEESIEIGKRTVDRGTTRIRCYVVETPVERDITLHGERVTIERRRPVQSAAPDHALEERTVEVRETEEVPVIEKAARVVEEIAIRKEETQRTETVHDTVRREEVEVTDKDGKRRTDS
jgi:uncharacterized protein (TIGR02271 family)